MKRREHRELWMFGDLRRGKLEVNPLVAPLAFIFPLSPSCLCLYLFHCHCPLASLGPIHICLSLLLGSRLVLVNFLVPSRPFSFISVAIHRFVSKAALRTQIVLQKVRTSTLLLVLLFHVPMTAHILIFIPTLSRALAIQYMASLCTVSCSCSCSYRCAGLCPRSCFCCCAHLYSHP